MTGEKPIPPKVVLQNTEGKNAWDVAVIQKIFENFEVDGYNDVIIDLNSSEKIGKRIKWNEDGRLVELSLALFEEGVALYDVSFKSNYNLDVSGCTALESLDCSSEFLSSLDVSGCSALTELNCGYNELTSLDVSECNALIDLDCRGNQLSSLDVSGCSALESLYCNDNQLSSLDVTNCKSLRYLNYDEDKVTVIGYPR